MTYTRLNWTCSTLRASPPQKGKPNVKPRLRLWRLNAVDRIALDDDATITALHTDAILLLPKAPWRLAARSREN